MKKIIHTIPNRLLLRVKDYIDSNTILSPKDLEELINYYPKSYKKDVTSYRIIGFDEETNKHKIHIKTDKSWTKDEKYPFWEYLGNYLYYYKFKAKVSGFDFSDFLKDCSHHPDIEIQSLKRFLKEKEVYAIEIKDIQLFDSIRQEDLINN